MEAEDFLKGYVVNCPLCSITLHKDNNRLIVEQSLELTWSGDEAVLRCMFKAIFVDFVFIHSDSSEFDALGFTTERGHTDCGITMEVKYRGDKQQPYIIAEAVKQRGGIIYFDKTLEVRKK
jgi:hypothetical protein